MIKFLNLILLISSIAISAQGTEENILVDNVFAWIFSELGRCEEEQYTSFATKWELLQASFPKRPLVELLDSQGFTILEDACKEDLKAAIEIILRNTPADELKLIFNKYPILFTAIKHSGINSLKLLMKKMEPKCLMDQLKTLDDSTMKKIKNTPELLKVLGPYLRRTEALKDYSIVTIESADLNNIDKIPYSTDGKTILMLTKEANSALFEQQDYPNNNTRAIGIEVRTDSKRLIFETDFNIEEEKTNCCCTLF